VSSATVAAPVARRKSRLLAVVCTDHLDFRKQTLRGVLPEHGGDLPPAIDLPQADLPARHEAKEQYQRRILVR